MQSYKVKQMKTHSKITVHNTPSARRLYIHCGKIRGDRNGPRRRDIEATA